MVDQSTSLSFVVRIDPDTMFLIEPPTTSYELGAEWENFAQVAQLKVGSMVGFHPKQGVRTSIIGHFMREQQGIIRRRLTFSGSIIVCRLT